MVGLGWGVAYKVKPGALCGEVQHGSDPPGLKLAVACTSRETVGCLPEPLGPPSYYK